MKNVYRSSILAGFLLAISATGYTQTSVGFGGALDSFKVDPPSQSKSGLLRLQGSGFGGVVAGTVKIGGIKAPIARWQDDLIECYVPESANFGMASVEVVTSRRNRTLSSRMKVVAREVLGGRQTWRLKLADQYVSVEPAIGPDGTIYAVGNFGHLYAVNPNGGLKWVVSPSGGVAGMVDVLPSGDVVVGGGGGVQVLSKEDGSRLWSFAISTPLLAGPNVGPDGNIYAADDSRWSQNVIGAFVLSPTGNLLWSGGKYYRRGGGWTPQRIKFGGGHAYFWSDASDTGDPTVLAGFNALNLGGGLDWRISNSVGIMPGALPDGRASLFTPSTLEQRNATGNLLWQINLNTLGGQPQDQAVLAPDGRTYVRISTNRLVAVSPSGSMLWTKTFTGMMNNHTLRQDGNLIVLQTASNFGQPNNIQGLDTQGNVLWSTQLQMDNGMASGAYHHMTFNSTGSTVYFGTAGPYDGQYTAHCYLYAINAQ